MISIIPERTRHIGNTKILLKKIIPNRIKNIMLIKAIIWLSNTLLSNPFGIRIKYR